MFKNKNKNKNNSRTRDVRSKDNPVFMYTYHNVRDNFDDKKERKEKKELIPKLINPFKKLSAFMVLLILIIAVINLLYLSSTPKVFLLNNNSKISNLYNNLYGQEVYSEVKNYLNSSLLNYNKLSINLNGLNKDIASKFPIVSNTSYNIPLFKNQVEIYLTTSSPALIVSNNSHNYILNQNGEVILDNQGYNVISSLDIPKIITSTKEISLGSSLLSQQEVSFIQSVYLQLTDKNYQISYMKISGGGEELDVYIKGKSFYVKFNLSGSDARLEAGRFLATMNYLNNNKINPTQYIDVRSEGRVFYK